MRIMGKLRTYEEHGITEGVIWKQLLIFFFPIILGTFFQQLYNTVDAVVVGQFVGKEALAAVGGPTGVIINLLVGFFVGLSSGATVIISQYYGAQQDEQVSRAVHTAIALAVAAGAVMMAVGLLFAPWALGVIDTPAEIMGNAVTYLRIYFLGMIPSLIYNMGAGILRAVGDSRRPLYFLICGCLVNIVLDLLFVLVFHMGVAGAAIATIISQAVSAVLVVFTLVRTTQSYRLFWKKIRFSWDMLKRIVTIGLPAGLQSVMYSFSVILIQSHINTFGTDTVAAWTAYGKIDAIFWMAMDAFGVSITTFVGQNFGARKYDRIHKSVKVCLGMAMGVTIVMSVLLFFFSQYIYRIFTQDQEVIAKGIEILQLLVPFWFTYVSIAVLAGAARGAGDAIIPMIMTCVGVCVLRILWLFTVVPLRPTLQTVLLSFPITWAVTSVIFIIYYLQGGWLRRRRAAGDPDPSRPQRRRQKAAG